MARGVGNNDVGAVLQAAKISNLLARWRLFDFVVVLVYTQWRQVANRRRSLMSAIASLWSPYGIGQAIIFSSCFFLLSFFFSSPNLSGRRLDVYHTSAHGVAIVRI